MTTALAPRRHSAAPARTRPAVADGDIHPTVSSYRDLFPFLARRWQEHLSTYGTPVRHAWQRGAAYPKAQPAAARRDAWPEGGGLPGSDLATMQRQHLDPHNIQLGILNPITFAGQGVLNPELSAALATAVNDWQVAMWASREPRLRASVVVPYEHPAAAVAEIERRAGDPAFAQVLLLSRTAAPLGQRPYWPIYAAAAQARLPVGIHAFGYSGYPVTGSGWPSYYIEEMFGHSPSCQAGLTSLVVEGVFERWPELRVVLIEAGCAWLPSLAWRLDRHWHRLRSEVPHLRRPPSAYIRDHVWVTTQPIEEPEPRDHLVDVLGWIGWDRILFSSDYPHWDFDDPVAALPARLPSEARRGLLHDNARALYGEA